MKKVADLFFDWLVESEIVRKDDRELYAYGFWQGGVLLFNFLTVAVIGIVTGMFWQSVVFTIAYGLLRPVAGGFHARTQRNCYFYSILLLVLALGVLRWDQWDAITCMLIVLASGCVVFKLAPVEDENKPLDDVEVVVYRHRSRIICGVLAIVVSILLLVNEIEMASCIAVSILAASVMLVLGEARNRYVDAKHYSRA